LGNVLREINYLELMELYLPVSIYHTIAKIHEYKGKQELYVGNYPVLILMPALIHDFLCIHPFDEGNGRMSRILTLLLLYKFGCFVGRYTGIEMLIEES